MVEIERLRDEIKRSPFHRLNCSGYCPVSRDHDDRRVKSSLAYFFQNIEPILNWHLDIEENQLWTFLLDLIQTLSPIAGHRNSCAQTAQRVLENVTDIGVIIRNKYASDERCHFGSLALPFQFCSPWDF